MGKVDADAGRRLLVLLLLAAAVVWLASVIGRAQGDVVLG